MNLLWKLIRGFFGFWYDFVIGDDWAGAAGVAVLIGGSWLLLHFGVAAFWFGPVSIVATSVLLVSRRVRRSA
ncbi:MAG TPA: hypothetical protein VFN68_10430 [Acidimicrobiales bacterium]|nr:hypothetical protein [Acidimicrobiales bacterium]